MPKLVTYLNWTSIFEWYVGWCGSKNGTKKARFKEIGLRAPYMIIILGSIV